MKSLRKNIKVDKLTQLNDLCKTCLNAILTSNVIYVHGRIISQCQDCVNKLPTRGAKRKAYFESSLTKEEYDKKLKSQNNVCAVCNKSCLTGQPLAIDHSHKLNLIRGLLCFRCNSLIDFARDSTQLFEAVIIYLRKHGIR